MKTATITYSNAQNYGALLQAYALVEYLRKMGHSPDLIDYRAFDQRWFKPRKTLSDVLFTALMMCAGKRRVRRFLEFRELLPLTAFCRDSADLSKLNGQYDAWISGSDQVWNCNARVNDDFFLRFVHSPGKKIAYAASFGSDSVPEESAETVRRYIKDFDFVSVREKSGALLVEELTGERPPVTVDPAFLLSKEEWRALLPAKREHGKPYIFVYTTELSKRLEKIVQTAHQKTGLPVISTQYIPGCGCRVKKDIGPREFLGFIDGASQIISTSFHATAFSVIFEKDFCVVPHSRTGARVIDLLEDLGISERIVLRPSEWRERALFSWDETRRIVEQKKMVSMKYLNEALGGEQRGTV